MIKNWSKNWLRVTIWNKEMAPLWDQTNLTEKNREISSVGNSKKTRGICWFYFSAPPKFFHNFVSFHPILMFLTILESGDITNNIGDELKTIWLILINI